MIVGHSTSGIGGTEGTEPTKLEHRERDQRFVGVEAEGEPGEAYGAKTRIARP